MNRELLENVLQALKEIRERTYLNPGTLIEEVEAELAKPGPDPVAWMNRHKDMTYLNKYHEDDEPLYTSPPSRKPLSDDEIERILGISKEYKAFFEVARAIEKAHGITE